MRDRTKMPKLVNAEGRLCPGKHSAEIAGRSSLAANFMFARHVLEQREQPSRLPLIKEPQTNPTKSQACHRRTRCLQFVKEPLDCNKIKKARWRRLQCFALLLSAETPRVCAGSGWGAWQPYCNGICLISLFLCDAVLLWHLGLMPISSTHEVLLWSQPLANSVWLCLLWFGMPASIMYNAGFGLFSLWSPVIYHCKKLFFPFLPLALSLHWHICNKQTDKMESRKGRFSSFFVRFLSTAAMISSFVVIIYMGHVPLVILIFLIQVWQPKTEESMLVGCCKHHRSILCWIPCDLLLHMLGLLF